MKKTPSFLAAFYFLTSLPLPGRKVSLEDTARGLWAFPFVGLFVGIFLFVLARVCRPLFPGLLFPGVILLAWVWITGGLHLDGYIDCCDGLLASASKEKRLIILKDVATGSFGVVGGIILLLLKFSAIASIAQGVLPMVLLISGVTGRCAMLYVIFRFPYARPHGLGRIFKDSISPRDIVLAGVVLLSVGICFFFFYSPCYLGFVMIGISVVFCEVFGLWVLGRIPGFTGDVYGAVCELVELTTLMTAAVVQEVVL